MRSKIFLSGVVVLFCFFSQIVPVHSSINWDMFRAKPDISVIKTYPYHDCFMEAAQRHKVPILLLLSVAKGESNFNPRAVSDKDALGIMQILWPGTAKDLGFKTREEVFDPCKNIDAGARYLKLLLERFDGDIYLTLCSYFAGPNRISKGPVPGYADDYSNYIYSKLVAINGDTKFERKIYSAIMAYDNLLNARRYVAFINQKDGGIPLEINKNAMNQYVVSLAVKNLQSRRKYVGKIEVITGMKLKE